MGDTSKRFFQNIVHLGGAPAPQGSIEVECEVVAQLTGTNSYVLRRVEGPVITQESYIIGVDGGASMPYGHGVSETGTPMPPGTRVRVLEAPLYADASVTSRPIARQIVGVCNELPSPSTEYYPPWTMDSDPIDSAVLDDAIRAYIGMQSLDHLNGLPMDLAPGDWGVFGMMKNGIYVGAGRTSVTGSPIAGIHFYPDDSTVVLNKGLEYVEDTPWSRKAELLDVDGDSVDIEHRAGSFSKAVGAEGDQPVSPPVDESLSVPAGTKVRVQDGNLPQWDEMNYGGGAVNGRIFQRVVKRSGDIPVPVASDFTGADGLRMNTAAHSHTLSRSADMPLLEYIREFDSSEPEDDAQGTPIEDPMEEPDFGDYSSMYADLMYELMRMKFAERYWAKLKARNKDWTALGPADFARKMARAIADSQTLPRLGDDEPVYKDRTIPMKDPILGDDVEMRLARLESFIHLSPSGSVVLSDATGSEIRLEGGAITVSPAADLRMLPGRDTIIMTPRTLSMTGGGRVELTSDKGEMDIHADRNLAISSEKVLTVESRDPDPVVDAAYDKRGVAGGGLVLRSASGAHLVGNNVRLAVQGPRDSSATGVRKQGNGAIVIDAGGSPFCIMADTISQHADRDICISSGDDGNALILDGSNTTLSGDTLVASVKSTLFGGAAEVKWLSVKTDGKPSVHSKVVTHNDDVSVGILGSLAARHSLAAENFAGGNGVFRTLRSFTGREQESLYIPPKQRSETAKNISAYSQLDTISVRTATQAAEFSARWYSNGNDPLLTADGVRRLGIYYPNADGYSTTRSFWVTSRWQRMLKTSGAGSWKPVQVKDADGNAMLFFPGYDMWTDTSKAFLRSWTVGAEDLDSPTSLQSSWTVNCTMEK